mgnify:CR=1 FL=1
MNYTTQMDAAKKGIITEAMKIVAIKEGKSVEEIRALVAEGKVAIPANKNHKTLSPEGVGQGLRTKINVNLGISKDCCDCEKELDKVRTALEMKAEAIMDLSNYGKTAEMRKTIVEMSTAMLGTVPIYDALGYYDKDLKDLTAKEFLDVVEKHGQDGVDFVTIHAGLNREAVETVKRNKRLTNVVSRGGSLLFAWMELNNAENPFFEYYDDLLDICAKYDITLSLGDALRPGSINDASDASQIKELITLGELTKRAWEKNVQVMVEGPGHMTIDEIAANMKLEKHIIDRRVHLMEEEGVVFKTKAGIETKKQVQELYKEFDRVVLACGSKKARDIQVPGRDAKGIYFAVDYLTRITKSLLNSQLEDKDFVETKDKNVLVIGGGPAGMEAAYVAKKRGHDVVLCEKTDRLGGQLLIACVPIGKQEITKVVKYMKNQLEGVDIRYNTTVTKEMIETEFKDYEIITTVGATPKEIEPYKVFKQTMTADDILSGKKFPGRKIVIIGGGSVGCETADYLAPLINDLFPTNRDITLIEMTKGLMTGESGATKSLLTRRMMEKGVKIELNSKITYVDENTIKYEKNHQEYVLDDVDTLVFAVGYNPVASPIENAHLIGDCQKVGTLKDAITNAYQITKEI